MPRRQGTPRHDAPEAITASSVQQRQTQPPFQIKKRVPAISRSSLTEPAESSRMEDGDRLDERQPLLESHPDTDNSHLSWIGRNQWIVFALASGACAAFNGVFAKL